MPDPYIGEVRVFPFHFAPKGWAECNGQLLSIQQNQALFAVLGTRYGGDGMSTFALPNLMGRVPVQIGNNVNLGQAGGEEAHVLIVPEMPLHTHTAMASTNGADQVSPSANVWASVPGLYSANENATMNPAAVQSNGFDQGHDNLQPYCVFNICIATTGIFPTRN